MSELRSSLHPLTREELVAKIESLRAERDTAIRQQGVSEAVAEKWQLKCGHAEDERDALAALLREWRECDEAGRHPECNAESWRPWRREIAAKVDAALAKEKT